MSPLMNRQAFTVSRPATITRTKGRVVKGTPTTFSITGSAQSLTGDDLEHIPPGDRDRERLALSTRTKLINRDEVTEVATGVKYQVENVGDWSKQGMHKATKHYRAIIVLKEDQ